MRKTLTSRVAYNTIIQIISKGVTTLIGVATIFLLTRYLSVTGYGEYTTVFAFLGFFAIVADFGLFSIIVRDIAKTPEKKERIFNNIFTLRILLAITLLIVPPLIAIFIPQYSMNVKLGVAIAGFSSFFILLNQLLVALFQVNLRMDKFVISDIVGRALILLLVILFIHADYGFLSIIIANVFGNVLSFAISFALASKFLKVRLRFDFSYWKQVFLEAVPLGLVVIMGLIYFKIDQVILSLLKDSWSVGIYGAPYKIIEILITIPAIFVGSTFPIISSYIAKKDNRLANSFQKTFDFLALMALPIVVGVFVTAKQIISIVAGPEFTLSVPLLQILIFAVGIIFFGNLAGNAIIAGNMQKRLLKIYMTSLALNIIANLIFIPLYSYYAAAVITVATEVWAVSAAYFILWRGFAWYPKLGYLLKATVASIIMGVAVKFLGLNNFALQIIVGIISYPVALWAVGGLNKNMIRMVLGKTEAQ